MIFSIVCKCISQVNKEDIINSVRSIRRYHPEDLIIVVDSGSPDKSYFDSIREVNNLIIEDINNLSYETGAMWFVYEKYHSDVYVFMQDSMTINRSLNEFKDSNIKVINVYNAWMGANSGDKDFAKREMEKTQYTYREDNFKMVQFNSLLVKRNVLDKLKNKGFNNIVPLDKHGSCAMERVLGIGLTDEGYLNNDYLFPPNTFTKIWRHRR